MNRFKYVLIWVFGIVLMACGQLSDPFSVEVQQKNDQVIVSVVIPEKHYLYADNFAVMDALGNEQKSLSLPDSKDLDDPVSGKPKPVFYESFTAVFDWEPVGDGSSAVHVKYWGCNDSVCFIPQTKVVDLSGAVSAPADHAPGEDVELQDWQVELKNFDVRDMRSGSMDVPEFIEFLSWNTDQPVEEVSGFRLFLGDPVAFVRESGLLLTIVFILIGGLALNLTPCVLPMIPINLAIIGAGAQAGSKGRGFALGAVYGLGIALVYGVLGLLAVTLADKFQFGVLQSNPWFNLVIATIFVVLALAMFDVFHIDFTRFQSKMGGKEQAQGRFITAFFMGSVAAFLAGACVAPVVIAVILLATSLGPYGLFLPFVLGIGMALPWPFAGAGLSFLPKPGQWMEKIKYAFGVGIVLFAAYYGNLSFRGFMPTEVTEGIDGRTNEGFAEVLQDAHSKGLPVILDFTASWCKNCKDMEKNTLTDAAVQNALEEFVFVKYVSEDPKHPDTAAVWSQFGVQGLPTFVILEAR